MAKFFGKHNDPKHDKLGPEKGGGTNLGRAHRGKVSLQHRGGVGSEGQAKVPGNHGTSVHVASGGAGHAGSEIANHFNNVHSGGHPGVKGKHAAKGMTHHVGAHKGHKNHPHNLPKSFGGSPVGLDD